MTGHALVVLDGSVVRAPLAGEADLKLAFRGACAEAKKLGPRKDVEYILDWLKERGLKLVVA